MGSGEFDCMTFNAVFNNISVSISRRPEHLSMLFLIYYNQYSIFFRSHWLLSDKIIDETIDNDEKGINPIETTIINPKALTLSKGW